MAPERDTTLSRGELVRRRVMAIVILAAVAVAIMALTDAAPFFDDVTEEERVTDVVERFFNAYQEGDFAAVCDLFSDDVSRTIAQIGATETKHGEPKGCAAVLEARFGAAEGEGPKLSVKIENVRVSGPRAVADVVVKTEEVPKGRDLPIELERTPDGDWLITRQVITS
jgi:uncharacterized protein (TIGR02246 family)